MIKSIVMLLAAGALVFPFPAFAGCTLGHKQCKSGWLHVCERCGSETCWIFKGTKCVRDDDRELPAHARENPLARALLVAESSGDAWLPARTRPRSSGGR